MRTGPRGGTELDWATEVLTVRNLPQGLGCAPGRGLLGLLSGERMKCVPGCGVCASLCVGGHFPPPPTYSLYRVPRASGVAGKPRERRGLRKVSQRLPHLFLGGLRGLPGWEVHRGGVLSEGDGPQPGNLSLREKDTINVRR